MLNRTKGLWDYRELLYSITLREIKVRYKQSLLGAAWAVLQPLSMMVMFTIVFSWFAKIPSDGIPYPIFSYVALLPWGFFGGSFSNASLSVLSNASLVTKIYFPREIFPLASVLAAGLDFAIASVIFLAMMVYYKVPLTLNLLYVAPLVLLQIAFVLGVSLWAAAVNVRYRDVKYALPFVIQLWMFATPVIYPISMVPEQYRSLYMLNPMTSIIDGYRRTILQGQPPDLLYLGLATLVTVVVFLFSYGYFKRQEMTFADII